MLALVCGLGLTPRPGAWRRAWLALNALALVVTPVNLALETNFLYLRAKPTQATVFDWLGPWPLYLVGLEALAAGIFFLLERGVRYLRVTRVAPQPPTSAGAARNSILHGSRSSSVRSVCRWAPMPLP